MKGIMLTSRTTSPILCVRVCGTTISRVPVLESFIVDVSVVVRINPAVLVELSTPVQTVCQSDHCVPHAFDNFSQASVLKSKVNVYTR